MVDKDHDRHPAAEKACRQGRGPPRLAPCHPASGEGLSAGVGCCPAPGGNDWPPTFGSSRGTKAAKGDAELLTPALGPSKDDTCHRTAGRLAGAHAGKCRLPPLGMCTGWGLPVPLRGSEVCARGASAPGGVCRCPCGEARCVQEGQGMPMQGVAGRTCRGLVRMNCRRRIVLRDPAHGIQICAMSKNVSRAAGQHIICR